MKEAKPEKEQEKKNRKEEKEEEEEGKDRGGDGERGRPYVGISRRAKNTTFAQASIDLQGSPLATYSYLL